MNTRRMIALVTIGFLVLVAIIDMVSSETPNPYVQPPLLSLGSGQAASGAMCTMSPGPPDT